MDKLKFGLFDIFVYTVPGIITFFSVFIFELNLAIGVYGAIEILISTIETVSTNVILLILFLSYILGFVLHFFGYNYFNIVGKFLWRNKIKGNEQSLSIMEGKLVLLRHYSKENFLYVEQWMAFRAMSFNLSVAFLIIALVILTKLIISKVLSLDWIIVIIGFLFISIVTLRRAVTFHIWSHNTSNEAVKTLNLIEKK